MLTFTKYDADGNGHSVAINPRDVSAVIEDERRPHYGFSRKVARILLRNGQEVTVLDDDRRAANRIDVAEQASESNS